MVWKIFAEASSTGTYLSCDPHSVKLVVFAITDPGQLGTYFCRLFPLLGNGGVAVNAQDIVKYLQGYGGLLAIGIVLCIPAVFDFYEKHKKNPVVILMLFVLFWISIYFVSSTAGNPFMYLNF